MLPELKHFPVNWIDGMKISEHHFNQLENSIIDRFRDTAALTLTNFNYGLLPPKQGATSSLELSTVIDQSGLIRVRLKVCRAITAGGARVEISSENASMLNAFETTINPRSKESLYIVLAVKPFERLLIGQPDPEEEPLRHPFAVTSCKIEAIPESELNTNLDPAYHLILGRLKSSGNEIFPDTEFIPSSSTVQSHPKLIEEYQNLGNLLGQIGQYATVIVQKVKTEKQKTDLAVNVMYVAEKFVFFLADKIAPYRWTIPQMPPVFMIEMFLSFAYLAKSSFDCQTEKEREQMFTYFQQWTDLTPAQFQDRLTSVIEIEYNHQDIAGAIFEIKNFTSVMVKLFTQLSKLKYIGDKPDSGVVIGETVEPKKPEPKKGWSFLNE